MKWWLFLSILLVLMFIFISNGITGYLESAHGNSTYGVNRQSTNSTGYAQGNCAHCHEMHASIGGVEPAPASGSASPFALFANNFNTAKIIGNGTYLESDDFCFYCHSNSTTSIQVGGIINYDYSATFGGAPPTVTSIMDAFNQASYHNLYDVGNFSQNNLNFSYFFTSSSNPCVACHNPHLAKRDKANPSNATYTAISRPSDHGSLWGDDLTERMSYYATGYIYQAPYYYNSTTSYEPGGSSISDGSNMPDYVTFCTDCHNATNTIVSNALGRTLRPIDWLNEKHGKGAADVEINVKLPYVNSTSTVGYYVLSCLDCHEPHGSPNIFLIRREVNGGILGSVISNGTDLGWLCRQCHKDDNAFNSTASVNSWCIIHHNTLINCGFTSSEVTEAPYSIYTSACSICHPGGGPIKPPIDCLYCHYHGSFDPWNATRRTF